MRSGINVPQLNSLSPKTANVDNTVEPMEKRSKCEEHIPNITVLHAFQQEERVTTVIDSQTLYVAHTIGKLVAKMHASRVIHGDLTTSNIMIRNPPWLDNDCNVNSSGKTVWVPQLVLIDFGLATSIASTTNHKANNNSNKRKAKPHKQQHNAEEKAVDLYVLERAFLSTHLELELLVEEVWKGYRCYFESLDCKSGDDCVDGKEGGESETAASSCGAGEGAHGQVAKAVLNQLEQVVMRGRKRECFG